MLNREFDVSGAHVYHDLVPTPYQALKDALASLGYGECCPNPRSDHSALTNALGSLGGTKNRKVISRKKSKVNGVELVVIDKQEYGNDYRAATAAKVVESRVVTENGYLDDYLLTEEFLRFKAVLTVGAVGKAIANVVEKMDGQLSIHAGLHYLPEHRLVEFERVANAIEACQEGNKITISQVVMNDRTARSVLAKLTEDVRKETAAILDAVTNPNIKADPAKVQVRVDRSEELMKKVECYSFILSSPLDELKQLTSQINAVAAAAILQELGQSMASV